LSDYYSEPHIETTSAPLPPPSEHAAGESAGTKEAIQGIKDEILEKLGNSKDDDATDYVEERRDREAEERGEALSPQRERDRLGRFQKALNAADDSPAVNAHQEGHQEGPDDWQRDLQRRDNSVRAIAKHEMRVAEFSKANPDYQETIKSIFSVFPLAEHVAEAFLQSEIGPELAYRLAQNFDQIETINAMTPDQLRLDIARVEGMRAAQNAQQQQPARRATKAPRPLTSVRGGSASPSFDPATSDMDTYVAKRKAGWRG
jgi:hypothetical protein